MPPGLGFREDISALSEQVPDKNFAASLNLPAIIELAEQREWQQCSHALTSDLLNPGAALGGDAKPGWRPFFSSSLACFMHPERIIGGFMAPEPILQELDFAPQHAPAPSPQELHFCNAACSGAKPTEAPAFALQHQSLSLSLSFFLLVFLFPHIQSNSHRDRNWRSVKRAPGKRQVLLGRSQILHAPFPSA